MNKELLNELALQTGGSHYPSVFATYQNDYTLRVLSEVYCVFTKQQFDGYSIDFWDDIVSHFQLDNTELEKLYKNNKQSA